MFLTQIVMCFVHFVLFFTGITGRLQRWKQQRGLVKRFFEQHSPAGDCYPRIDRDTRPPRLFLEALHLPREHCRCRHRSQQLVQPEHQQGTARDPCPRWNEKTTGKRGSGKEKAQAETTETTGTRARAPKARSAVSTKDTTPKAHQPRIVARGG